MAFPPLVEPLGALSDAERLRTARHAVLAGFGDEAQRRLAASRVAVVGAGGLGSPVVLALAAAGVGTITVIDDDDVDASNLQRQVMHRVGDVGRPKVDSAVRVAAGLSPETVVVPRQERLGADSAERLLADAHVVIDGSDTFETRSIVAHACEALGVPLVWGVVQEFHAQATVFWSSPPGGAGIRLRDLYPPESVGDVPSCSAVGVLGPLCLQVGSILATEAIKLLTGVGEPLFGRVLVIDALRGRTTEVALRPASAASPSPSAVDAAPISAGTQPPELTAAQARTAVAAGAALVDVREPHETARGVIPGSALIPLAALLADPRRLDAQRAVVVCEVGVRAQRAASALRAVGVDASVLAGGIRAWDRATVPA